MYLIGGKKIDPRRPYVAPDGVRYPHLLDAKTRTVLGVIEVADPVRPDSLFYTATENEDGSLSVTPKSMADARMVVLARINELRDSACAANVMAHGRPWQVDPRSRDLLNDAITRALAGRPLPPVWRDADNEDMSIEDIEDLLAITDTLAANVQNAYMTSWARKASLENCQTVEAVAEFYRGLA